MIILETNVIAEPMRPRPDSNVIAWLDRQAPGSLFTTAVNLAELLVGVALLPAGKKRDRLRTVLLDTASLLFGERILPFDRDAASSYAPAVSWARSSGTTIAVPDGQIAAIAISHGFAVATRDAAPFIAAGVAVIDPWIA